MSVKSEGSTSFVCLKIELIFIYVDNYRWCQKWVAIFGCGSSDLVLTNQLIPSTLCKTNNRNNNRINSTCLALIRKYYFITIKKAAISIGRLHVYVRLKMLIILINTNTHITCIRIKKKFNYTNLYN